MAGDAPVQIEKTLTFALTASQQPFRQFWHVAEDKGGWCQSDANQSLLARGSRISSPAEHTPLGKGGSSGQPEDVPAGEAAFVIEVVWEGGVNGGEFLEISHAPEPEHEAFLSPEW